MPPIFVTFFVVVLSALSFVRPVVAQEVDGPVLTAIMKEVRDDNWDIARALAANQSQIHKDIIEWRYQRAGLADLPDVLAFLSRNGDWPGLDRIRTRAEARITDDTRAQDIVAFFAGRAPETGNGAVQLIRAFRALGRDADAQAEAVLAWRTLALSEKEHADILTAYGRTLADHHIARLDEMLWQGEVASARLMLDLVPSEWRALGAARIALREQANGVDALIAAVPAKLAGDGGLAYERFIWRIRKGRREDAIALMDERSITMQSLGRVEPWARRRHDYAHRMLLDGQYDLAYRLAANHFLTDGSTYAELEWLSGFLALRFLNQPEVALAHFLRFEGAVASPISLSRAEYWQGRALEVLGRKEEALAAYAKGGVHQTAFYGQLSAEKAGMAMDPSLIGDEIYPSWKEATFAGSTVLRAALLFAEAGERNLAEWFMTHLAEPSDALGQAQITGLALDIREPHIALRIAKVAAQNNVVFPRAYFPLTGLEKMRHPVDTALVLSIARRESEFDPAVTSGAGARGLMQVMPGTAKDMARALDIAYSGDRLLTDPDYNARLGGAYLKKLVDEFGNNFVLVAAGYNAGPSRPARWMEERGDPRSKSVDVIDWIEMIPFDETRNYVMRVTESLAVYRARMAGKPVPITLSKDLKAR